jgi:hypothetical protein
MHPTFTTHKHVQMMFGLVLNHTTRGVMFEGHDHTDQHLQPASMHR